VDEHEDPRLGPGPVGLVAICCSPEREKRFLHGVLRELVAPQDPSRHTEGDSAVAVVQLRKGLVIAGGETLGQLLHGNRGLIAYTFLGAEAVDLYGGFRWPVPHDGAPVAWVDAHVHACRERDLPAWLDDELWRVELEPPVEAAEELLTARRGRLLAQIVAWDAAAAGEFAADCVQRARRNAVEALQRAGLAKAADELASAADVQASAVRHAADDAVALLADVIELGRGGRPDAYGLAPESPPASPGAIAANVGFVVAHAIAASASDYDAAFAAERDVQTAWLGARLELVG
jgi:hypothetical protein